jgi:hypothetical protein
MATAARSGGWLLHTGNPLPAPRVAPLQTHDVTSARSFPQQQPPRQHSQQPPPVPPRLPHRHATSDLTAPHTQPRQGPAPMRPPPPRYEDLTHNASRLNPNKASVSNKILRDDFVSSAASSPTNYVSDFKRGSRCNLLLIWQWLNPPTVSVKYETSSLNIHVS